MTAAYTLAARRYRWVDRVTKLVGVVLVAAGLAVGGSTAAGIALAAAGVCIGLLTTVIESDQ